MATSQDAVKVRGRKSWVIPAAACVCGCALSLGIVAGLNMTGRAMPALAAVEIRLATPKAVESAAIPVAEQDSRIASVWERDDRYLPIRGNELEIDGDAKAEARVEPVNFSIVEPVVNAVAEAPSVELVGDPNIRWFNARPVRPAKTMWMTVTGYTPDEQSCGDSADGLTATMHSVNTNAMRMVAADTSVLPYGSMVSVPGYDDASIVPVLDCGGAIKGAKLDLLFATNQEAKQWGRQRVLVTVWEYADGKPADNPRKLR